MNKTELIDALSQKCDFTKADAARAVDGLIDVIAEALTKGESVAVLGFGNFTITERAARVGRNPKTGEPLQIAASKSPKFTAGSKLKAAINGK